MPEGLFRTPARQVCRLNRRGPARGDRTLLWSGDPRRQSSAPPHTGQRTVGKCREDLFDLRTPHRLDQARQGANAARVRPQSLSCRKREGPYHAVQGVEGKPLRRRPCGAVPQAPHEGLWSCPTIVWRRSRLFQRTKHGLMRAQWRQHGVYSAGKKAPEREAFEKSAAFKKGQRFRAGIEGRISVLARGRGMKRCLAEGSERFELWVGAVVLANNLMVIASLQPKRSPHRRRDAG